MAAEEETTMAAAIMAVVATAVVSVVVEAAEVEAIAVAAGLTSTMVLTTMVVGLVAMVAFTLRDTMANSTPTFMKATLVRELKCMEASPMLMDEGLIKSAQQGLRSLVAQTSKRSLSMIRQ